MNIVIQDVDNSKKQCLFSEVQILACEQKLDV